MAFLPALQAQRDLLDIPRGEARFQEYIARLTANTRDVALPIGDLNPMSRGHVRDRLDAWIACGIEAQARAEAARVHEELGAAASGVQAALVVPDDVHGAWTDRDRVDFRFRFEDKGRVDRGFATVQVWASEEAGAHRWPVVQRRLRASIYRTAYQRTHGLPQDLPSMLRQEGLALSYSGWPWHTDPPARAVARSCIAAAPPTRADFGATFAILFGDEAATRLGYTPRGCPRYAAWDVAVEDAEDPVAALRPSPWKA